MAKCTRPVEIKGRKLPCGRCGSCKANRAYEWSLRLMHELDEHKDALFLTLTYNDENCPDQILKSHLQGWLKRVRLELGTRRIKYYAAGEYGERTGRPHYHAIVFGVGYDDIKLLRDAWPYGFIGFGSVSFASIKYTCAYVQKKLYGKAAKQEYGDKQVPFALMSKGMGKKWMEKNIDGILIKGGIMMQGVARRIPRYYVKNLKEVLTDDYWNDRFLEYMAGKREKEDAQGLDPLNAWKRECQARNQIEAEQAFWNSVKNPKF